MSQNMQEERKEALGKLTKVVINLESGLHRFIAQGRGSVRYVYFYQ